MSVTPESRQIRQKKGEKCFHLEGSEKTAVFGGKRDEVRPIKHCHTSLLFADFIITVHRSLSYLINSESLFVPQAAQLSNPFPCLTVTSDTLTFLCTIYLGCWRSHSWYSPHTAGLKNLFCPFSSHQLCGADCFKSAGLLSKNGLMDGGIQGNQISLNKTYLLVNLLCGTEAVREMTGQMTGRHGSKTCMLGLPFKAFIIGHGLSGHDFRAAQPTKKIF